MTAEALEGELVDPADDLTPAHEAPPVGRLFVAGWCRRCGAPYVASCPADATNGACSGRCAKRLRRADVATSDGRARRRNQRRRHRAAVAAQRRGHPCSSCQKIIHDEETAARTIAWMAEAGRGAAEAYPCPSGYGLHVRDVTKRHRSARKRAKKRRAGS